MTKRKYQETAGIPFYLVEVYRLGWNDAYEHVKPSFPGDSIKVLAKEHGETYRYFAASAMYNHGYWDGKVTVTREEESDDYEYEPE